MNSNKKLQYTLANGGGGLCLITPEISKEIAESENQTLRPKSPMSENKRGDTEKKIIASLPDEKHREGMQNSLRKRDEVLGKATPNANRIENSRSYIIVDCSEDANPKDNRLQLRTEPPTFIDLNPGRNILTVEEYPALKFGFQQIDIPDLDAKETDRVYNCSDVEFVDLSNFDASEMESMDYMFYRMVSLWRVKFGNINTPKLISTERAFSFTGTETDRNDVFIEGLNNIDFSKVKSMEAMFSYFDTGRLDLSNLDFRNVENADYLFESSNIGKLLLDNCKFSDIEVFRFCFETVNPMTISLIGLNNEETEYIVNDNENYRIDFGFELGQVTYIGNLPQNIDEKFYCVSETIWHETRYSLISKYDWILSEISGTLNGTFLSVIGRELKKYNLSSPYIKIGDHFTVAECGNIPKSGMEVPTAFLKFLYIPEFETAIFSGPNTNDFIIGNYYIAFTNNPEIKFYVPSLLKGFHTIDEAIESIRNNGVKDISTIKIINTYILDLEELPINIQESEIWSPYSSKKITSYELKTDYASLVAKREETRQAYIQNLLEIISNAINGQRLIISDINGQKHFVNLNEIVKISPDYSDKEIISADIFFSGNIFIKVNLYTFAAEISGSLVEESLTIPKNIFGNEHKMFKLPNIPENKFYDSLKMDIIKEYRRILDEIRI